MTRKYRSRLNQFKSYDILAPNNRHIATVKTPDQAKKVVKSLNKTYSVQKAGKLGKLLLKISTPKGNENG